ncbi:MAG TPA: ABC transporter ATP-binding protein [Anaerolineae bacterium]
MPKLEITNIEKEFDGAPLLRGVSLTVESGEIVCLLGPSGGGKTTLLRIIAGLEQPERGKILFAGSDQRDVPVHQRHFGMMFQDLALFPHRNVFDNVAFGLRMKNLSRDAIQPQVMQALELVGLGGFAERDVNNLSGGEQQRVALARSLAPQPQLLMLDEPLGALDRILREQLVADLRAILKRIGMTAIYVTHDQDEAFAIADRIAIMHAGRLVQIDVPAEIYNAPADAFVAQFLGLTNLFPGTRVGDDAVQTQWGTFRIAPPSLGQKEPLTVLIRPDRVRIAEKGHPARVEECTFRAGLYRLRLLIESGVRLIVETNRPHAIGARVALEIDPVELLPA